MEKETTQQILHKLKYHILKLSTKSYCQPIFITRFSKLQYLF